MSKLLAMTFPILPGKTDAWKKFIGELHNGKSQGFIESRERLGVRERTFLQETPMGSFVIVTLEGENPEAAFTKFGQGTDEFTKWFVKNVQELHGVDLTTPPESALPELIIDSETIAHLSH